MNARLAGLATRLALSGPGDWAIEPKFLKDLQDDYFHAAVSELPGFDNRKIIYDRLRSARGSSRTFVDRLIQLRSRLPEACLEEVLSSIGCDEPGWHEYWLKGGGANFAALLERLANDSSLARRLWNGLLARVTIENFADGDASGIGVLAEIAGGHPASLSREQQEQLDGWNAINLELVNPPKPQPPGKASTLASACRAANVTRESVTEQWFRSHVSTAQNTTELGEKAQKFGSSLLGFFETEDTACAHAAQAGRRPGRARAASPFHDRGCLKQSCRTRTTIAWHALLKASSARRRSGPSRRSICCSEGRAAAPGKGWDSVGAGCPRRRRGAS